MVYSWLKGEFSPEKPAFLDSLPAESGSGIAPNGYQYREYKNWRGIPKPRRCPFCKQAKGKIRRLAAAFKAFARISERQDRGAIVTMRRSGRGMGRVEFLGQAAPGTVKIRCATAE